MAAVINTNIASLNAQRNLGTSQSALNTSIQRLSSGLRINSAKDDAAGMAISDRMTSQIRGSEQAARNANDGISLAQTAEGSLSEVGNNLQRIRELAIQSANATNSASDRVALQAEVTQLVSEIDRVAQNTSFNGVKLLDGSFTSQTFQIGANGTTADQINVASIANARSSALGTYNGLNLTSQSVSVAGTMSITTTDTSGATQAYNLAATTDAKATASAINAAGVPGLTATVNANSTVPTSVGLVADAAAAADILTLNGMTYNAAITGNLATDTTAFVNWVSANSSALGVTAIDTGAGVKLTAASGQNITATGTTNVTGTVSTTNTAADALAAVGLTGMTSGTAVTGTFDLTYVAPAGVSSLTFAGTSTSTMETGGAAGVHTVANTGSALSDLDITDVSSLATNLASIDASLTTINGARADLGAIQNRFSSVISTLQTTTENLSAARSRIMDADFASETASLTRGQILQQAGTAMLAQANSLPNNVLSLLR
jgi:flagellin